MYNDIGYSLFRIGCSKYWRLQRYQACHKGHAQWTSMNVRLHRYGRFTSSTVLCTRDQAIDDLTTQQSLHVHYYPCSVLVYRARLNQAVYYAEL